ESDRLIIGGQIETLDAAGTGNAGMSPENVHTAEGGGGIVDGALRLFGLRQISRDRRDLVTGSLHIGRKLGEAFGIDVDGRDFRSLPQEEFYPCPPHPGGGSGDDDKLVLQAHESSLSF